MTVKANTPKLRNAINAAINDTLETERTAAAAEVEAGDTRGAEQEKEELVRR